MSIVEPKTTAPSRREGRPDPLYLILGLSGIILSLVIAYLVVQEVWPFALALLFVIPGFILIHRYPFAALLIWLLLDPFLVATNGGTLRQVYWVIHRALPPFTVAIIVLSHMLKIHRRKLPRLGLAELAMVGYIGVTILSVLYLNDQVQATIYFLYDHIVIPILLYLIVRLTRPDEQDYKRMIPVLLFILLSQTFIGLLSWTFPQVLPSSWLGRVGTRTEGSLDSYSVFSATMTFCGVLLLQHGLNHDRPKLLRWGLSGSFLLAIVAVFFSFSRGSWLGAIIVLTGLFFLYPKYILRVAFFSLLIIVVVLQSGVMDSYLEYAQARFYSDQSEESALGRLPVILGSLRMFESKPLFGWGYENFDRYDYQFQGRVGDLVTPEKDHASHNLYLTLLAEQGLTGTLLYLTPVFWWLAKTNKALAKLPAKGFWSRKLLISLWLVVIFFVVVNNFSNMRVVFGLGLWWTVLGLIAAMIDTVTTPQLAEDMAPIPLARLAESRKRYAMPTGNPKNVATPLRPDYKNESNSRSLEKIWVSWLNSEKWRNFAKWGNGSWFFNSLLFRKANTARKYALTYIQNHLHPDHFKDTRTFCMFIGQAKSGGTMIGSLLDAHPEMIIADETDVLAYISSGFNKDQIFHILLKGSRREALKGRVTARRLQPYAFAVPGQWQSRYQRLKVIGHSQAGPSTRKLSGELALLDDLQKVMAGVDLKVIQVIRNPFDPISVMMVRGKRSFENAMNHYFSYVETLQTLRRQLGDGHLLPVRYEDFVNDPYHQLQAICGFLGVEASPEYLDACAGILYASPEHSRQMVTWKEAWIEQLQAKIDQVDFLRGYTYTNETATP